MPTPLPFSAVAVLDPALVFSFPKQPQFDRQMQSELKTWLANVRKNHADACYARVYTMDLSTSEALLKFLSKEIPLLVPAGVFPISFTPLAFHHRLAEKELLPRGPYLQGISCHGLEDLLEAEKRGFDYAFLSPVFSTATHPDLPPLGMEGLQEAVAAVKIPVIALGGVTLENAVACLAAGSKGWAAIRAFMR
jgi:hypothetical protein